MMLLVARFLRLEKLAFRAYPHDDQEGAKQLSRHLLATIPNWFPRNVEKTRETKRIMSSKAWVTWEDFVYIAELEDKKKKGLMKKDFDADEPFVAHVAATQNMVTHSYALVRSWMVAIPRNGRNTASVARSPPAPSPPPPPQCSYRTIPGVARSPPFQQTCRNSSSYGGFICCFFLWWKWSFRISVSRDEQRILVLLLWWNGSSFLSHIKEQDRSDNKHNPYSEPNGNLFRSQAKGKISVQSEPHNMKGPVKSFFCILRKHWEIQTTFREKMGGTRTYLFYTSTLDLLYVILQLSEKLEKK